MSYELQLNLNDFSVYDLAFVVPRQRGKRYPSFICISRFDLRVCIQRYIRKKSHVPKYLALSQRPRQWEMWIVILFYFINSY